MAKVIRPDAPALLPAITFLRLRRTSSPPSPGDRRLLPTYYYCSSCQEKFEFKFRRACYYVGPLPVGKQVPDDTLLEVPVRPAWCKDCACITIVEDIAPLRVFEDAYAAARSRRAITYPVLSEFGDPETIVPWRRMSAGAWSAGLPLCAVLWRVQLSAHGCRHASSQARRMRVRLHRGDVHHHQQQPPRAGSLCPY